MEQDYRKRKKKHVTFRKRNNEGLSQGNGIRMERGRLFRELAEQNTGQT